MDPIENNNNNMVDERADGEETPNSKRRQQRHTREQIDELERAFQENNHPNEATREELAIKLGLTSNQVKFWFQNRRTQQKSKADKGRADFYQTEYHRLKKENEELKKVEAEHQRCLSGRCCYHVGPSSSHNNNEGQPHHGCSHREISRPTPILKPNFNPQAVFTSDVGLAGPETPTDLQQTPGSKHLQNLEHAKDSMDEFLKVVNHQSLWITGLDGCEMFSVDNYASMFPERVSEDKRVEISRDTKRFDLRGEFIVQTIMTEKLEDLLPTMVSKSSLQLVLSPGYTGIKRFDGCVQRIRAEFHGLSPCLPTRDLVFYRHCQAICSTDTLKVWAIVDFGTEESDQGMTSFSGRLFPSGFLIREDHTGWSEVMCVKHIQVDKDNRQVPQDFFQELHDTGEVFGARRIIKCLESYFQFNSILKAQLATPHSQSVERLRSLMLVSNNMVTKFASCISMCKSQGWEVICGNQTFQISINKNPLKDHKLCSSITSTFYLPISPLDLFMYLKDPNNRHKWDNFVTNQVEQLNDISISAIDPYWAVYALHINPRHGKNVKVMVQESRKHGLGYMLVYGLVDVVSMRKIKEKSDCSSTDVHPSGVVIFPHPESRGCMLNFCIQFQFHAPNYKLEAAHKKILVGVAQSMMRKIKAAVGL